MWSALFGTAEKAILILKPDPSAVAAVHGFKGGQELRVSADADNQTIGDLLTKFNKYRGPDQQIRRVWSTDGTPVSLTDVLKGERTVVLRAASI
jgi:hypothetical protein